jgi:hypothetical protein
MQEGLLAQSTDNAWPAHTLELTEVARKTRGHPRGGHCGRGGGTNRKVDCNSSLSTLTVTPHSTGQDAQLQAPHIRVCVCVSLGQRDTHTACTQDAHRCRDAHSLVCCACCTPGRAEGAGANSERELDCANALDVQCAPLTTDPTAACASKVRPPLPHMVLRACYVRWAALETKYRRASRPAQHLQSTVQIDALHWLQQHTCRPPTHEQAMIQREVSKRWQECIRGVLGRTPRKKAR